MKLSSKNILFIVPRFHTNMVEWVSTLLNYNYEVKILAYTKSKIENYNLVNPIMLRKSFLNIFFVGLIEFFGFIFRLKRSYLYNLKIIFLVPNIFLLLKQISTYRPNLIIIREKTIISLIVIILNKLFIKSKIALYSQTYLDDRKFKLIDLFFPVKKISTIFKDPKFISTNKFLPFIYKTKLKAIIKHHEKLFYFLIIAKFEKRKRVFEFIKLFHESEYPKIINSFKFLIIGEVSSKEHITEFNKLNKYILDKNIDYILLKKNVHNSKMDLYYNQCNIFLLPSIFEAASYSNIQAMANGLVTIIGDKNGTSCYINENIDGYKFDSNNLNSILIPLNKLFKLSESELLKIRKNAFYKFKYKLNASLFIKKVMELMR